MLTGQLHGLLDELGAVAIRRLGVEPVWRGERLAILAEHPRHLGVGDADRFTVAINDTAPQPAPTIGSRQKVRAVQIDVDPTMIGMRYPFEVNLVGDAATTLSALLPPGGRPAGSGRA